MGTVATDSNAESRVAASRLPLPLELCPHVTNRPSAFGTVMAREGLQTCTCFLTKCHMFWNVLVLVWISIKTECSLRRELFLPPTLVARGPLIRRQWCHPPGLTSLTEAPDAGDEAELADELAQAVTALRFQRFKSRDNLHNQMESCVYWCLFPLELSSPAEGLCPPDSGPPLMLIIFLISVTEDPT